LKYDYQETETWKKYQEGIGFKNTIGLYKDVNDSIRHYSGNPWEGVVTNGLPVVSLPLPRRIVNHKVSIVGGDETKINYNIDGIDDLDDSPDKTELREVAKKLSAYAMTLWENLHEDIKNDKALLKAALTGDGIEYFSWNPNINSGNGVMGNIDSEVVNNVNYFPGNPNDPDVQSQTEIIIAFRKMVSQLQKEAKSNGIPKDEIDKICSDEETENQAGNMAKIELAKSGKAICLLRMWKDVYPVPHRMGGKTGVWFEKSSRYARITKGEIPAELTLYPVSMFNWYENEGCAHGMGEVKGIIPNAIAINKLVSMIILAVMHIAIPKMIYDSSRMAAPSNMIGGAIGVTGNPNDVAKYLTPGQLSNDIYKVIDILIDKTKEMLGATDAALGELNMDNTSALTVLQKASAIPSKPIATRYHKFIEDKARIWMDFFIHKYSVGRTLTYADQGITRTFDFDGSKYGDLQWRVKVDVGASSHWSEITNIQTLDNLLMNGHITFVEYLERMPNGIITMKEKLMQARAGDDVQRQVLMKLQALYYESLPPESKEQLSKLKPEELEGALQQMILQGEPQANQAAAVM
jgi:hypothetical protein